MTTPQTLPLNQLAAWDGNVRKAEGSAAALKELAASIAAHGILQSLVVRRVKKNRFAVIAGGRRLAALKMLRESGALPPDHPVPCQVIGKTINATELSLAENAMREDMHPADQFEAFRKLAENGLPLANIAATFGTSESVVEKRLKLARVSPVIVDAYRRDELTLEDVMAFAVTNDAAAQEALWNTLPEHRRHAHVIRAALTEGDIPASDKRVRYVTLKAYEKAGGTTRRDLFTDGDHGVFLLDAPLLETIGTISGLVNRSRVIRLSPDSRHRDLIVDGIVDMRVRDRRRTGRPCGGDVARQPEMIEACDMARSGRHRPRAGGNCACHTSSRRHALRHSPLGSHFIRGRSTGVHLFRRPGESHCRQASGVREFDRRPEDIVSMTSR